MKPVLLYSLLALFSLNLASAWEKHVVTEKGFFLTAVAGDYNHDGAVDVISSSEGKVILYLAPDWEEMVIHQFPEKKARCIHAETFDVDGDGDLDFLGSLANQNPFWIETPAQVEDEWTVRKIDDEISRIHCLLKADVNNDGRLDVLINHFEDSGEMANSMAWLEVPTDPRGEQLWTRHVFSDGDAPGGSHYFGFGDVDGDGWGEIATGAKGAPYTLGNWFAYWKNPGAEKVTGAWEKTVIAEKQMGATNIQIGDVNGDGKADFLATLGHGLGVVWFENPSWERHVIDAEMDSPHSLMVADLDADGDLDAASCGFKSERVSVYLNDGKGTFKRVDIAEGQASYDLRGADMDGDGDLDLLNAGRQTQNVAWFENPYVK